MQFLVGPKLDRKIPLNSTARGSGATERTLRGASHGDVLEPERGTFLLGLLFIIRFPYASKRLDVYGLGVRRVRNS